ncbi:MAG: phytanoyl-CoA dioxygenase family protein [Pseudomonadota bacterium]
MQVSPAPAPTSSSKTFVIDDAMRRQFRDQGYLKFERVVDGPALANLTQRIREAYDRAKNSRQLFVGGGTTSGHLNCFPGAESRFVYERLSNAGIIDIVQALSDIPLGAPNVGCNLNLPHSNPQNEHVDGYARDPFLVVNVAPVDTDLENGALEVLLGTHRQIWKYWQILVTKPKRIRFSLKQGDVLIRTSALWHRGMPNHSHAARPMLAFTWENGGGARPDSYDVHQGRITFLPNRYSTSLSGRVQERAFVALPSVGIAYRAIRSLFTS